MQPELTQAYTIEKNHRENVYNPSWPSQPTAIWHDTVYSIVGHTDEASVKAEFIADKLSSSPQAPIDHTLKSWDKISEDNYIAIVYTKIWIN